MTDRELEILEILKKNPMISQDEFASRLQITRSCVATHIHNLIEKGYLKGKGYIINDKKFVSIIGGNNIDILGISDEKIILHNSNPGKISYTFGGAGRNIAYALTKLDVPNYFITVYGNDLNGERFLRNCKENKMDVSCCIKIPGEYSSSFMYMDDSNGIKLVGINDMRIYKQLSPEFLSKYLSKINSTQYCVLDSNIPANSFKYLYQKVTVPLIVKTISINKNYRLIQGNQKIFVLITTPPELKELLSYYDEPYINIEHSIHFLLTKNIKNIFVFSIEDGLYFENETLKYHIKKSPNSVINTVGSTSVLTAVIIWGLQNKLTWNKILKYGYAAICITLQSKSPINSSLSISALAEQEKILFKDK